MITLKKSFELQNYLKGLFSSALTILYDKDYVTVTQQTHLRNKAYSEAENEEIQKQRLSDLGFDANTLIDFACYIQGEMELLTRAINSAKKSSDHDLDGMIAVNNQKRRLLERMVYLSGLKASEQTIAGIGTKFNGEGNQVNYRYDIKEVTTIDFDRNKVKAIASKLRRELDDTSAMLDKMQLDTFVIYCTIFEIGDSLEDAVDKWMSTFK